MARTGWLDRGGGRWVLWLVVAAIWARALVVMPAQDAFLVSLPNDSAMRLAVIRDLMAGQGWFDMSIIRLGPDANFDIHWSRLVDGPLAALIRLAGLAVPRETAEYLVLATWPLAMLAAGVALTARTARALAGPWAGLAAGLLAALSFADNQVYRPGAIDHHSVQLALLMAAMLGLTARARRGAAALAGVAIALSLAIGVETMPLLAVLGAAMALIWVAGGGREARPAAGFAAGLGLGLAVFFAVSAPAAAWRGGFCDALSADLALPVLVASAGLWLAARALSHRSLAARAAGLLAVGLGTGLVAVLFAPACLSNPYDALDPYLRDRWLALVSEAQSLPAMLESAFVAKLFLGYYVLAAVAVLISLGFAGARPTRRPTWLGFALMLAAALVLAFYQVRGTLAATWLAAVPVGAAIAALGEGWRATGRRAPALLALALFVAAVPGSWWAVAGLGARVVTGGPPPQMLTGAVRPAGNGLPCFSRAALARLAALEPGLIVANSNLGAQLLLNTPHRVLAAPYHRNQAGMRTALEILLAADADQAGRLLRAAGADYVVTCAGDGELQGLADIGFAGFGLALQGGAVPGFLDPIPLSTDSALRAWRLR